MKNLHLKNLKDTSLGFLILKKLYELKKIINTLFLIHWLK